MRAYFFLLGFFFIQIGFSQLYQCKHVDQHYVMPEYSISTKEKDYDMVHYKFQLAIDPAVKEIGGTVVATLKAVRDLDSIRFDFSDKMMIDSVFVNGQKTSDHFFESNTEWTIKSEEKILADENVEVTVSYHGTPISDGFGNIVQSTHAGVPILWSMSVPYGSRAWWPCNNGLTDKLDSIDVLITTKPQYRAASNGLLVHESNDGTQATYHWKHKYPIVPYLVCFAVTNYEAYVDEIKFDDGRTLPMLNYVYPENINTARQGTVLLGQVMRYYDSLFVQYPYQLEKYGHAQFGWGGGMEHQTMSFVSGYELGLLSHELAHQWFGDMVTCGSWQDVWLNEGFATYCEGLMRERFGSSTGKSFSQWKSENIGSITSSPSGSVYVGDTSTVGRIFDGQLSYAKAAYLLHMLRWVVGDEDFFESLRTYLSTHQYKFAITQDLKQILESVSSKDLDEFFEDWYYGQGYPSYNVLWDKTASNEVYLKLSLKTSHNSVDFFEMPVPLRIVGLARDTIIVINHKENDQLHKVKLDFNVLGIAVDPQQWILTKNNTVTRTNLTSIKENLESKIKCYPNPANTTLTIEGIQVGSKIELYNAIGDILYTTISPEEKVSIEVGNQQTGIYIIKISNTIRVENLQAVIVH